jgi:hypothetical protein
MTQTLNQADETHCNICGEDRSRHTMQAGALAVCVCCGAWEHMVVDGQNADFPAAFRCIDCWRRMPWKRRYRWLRWHLSSNCTPNPDDLEGQQIAMEIPA